MIKYKRSMALLTACILMIALVACQPTPDKPVVVQKGDGKLEQAVSQSKVPIKKYETPKKWETNFSRKESKLSVNVNANITIPDVEAYPVIKISKPAFTQEQVNKLAQVLFKGKPVYNKSLPLTKSQLEKSLVESKALLEKKKKDVKSSDNGIEDLEEDIKNTEEAIRNAPEKVEDRLASLKLAPNKYGEIRLDLKADLGKKQDSTLCLINKDSRNDTQTCFAEFVNTDNTAMFESRYEWGLSEDLFKGLKITKDDAVRTAKQLLKDLTVSGMEVAAVDYGIIGGDEGTDIKNNPKCVMVYFTRSVDKIPTTFERISGVGTPRSMNDMVKGIYPADYRPPCAYERILVCVDETGIPEFDWYSPETVLGKESSNVALLPFDQIQNTFKKQMLIKYADTKDAGDLLAQTYNINQITLGFTRISIKGNTDEYYLIPVWDFFGSSVMKAKDRGSTNTDPYESFLTINAVDGSVIDRSLGY